MEKIKNKKIVFIVLISLVIILSISLVAVLLSKDKGTSNIETNNNEKTDLLANKLGNAEAWKMFTQAVVLNPPTTENFYKKFNEIATYQKNIQTEFAGANFPTLHLLLILVIYIMAI